MTNLFDVARFPACSFGELYHQRWRIEEAFKRLKHRLNLVQAAQAGTKATQILDSETFPLTIYPHSYRKLSYDPVRDFSPVAVCAKTSLAFTVGPGVPDSVKTLADFVRLKVLLRS